MNQYEECINSMWEEIEGKRPKAEGRRTEQDRWKELKQQFYGTNTIVFTEWGTIDFDPERVKEIENASNITYDEYLEIMRSSGRNVRHDFEQCFYESFGADFKGQIEKKTNGRICFQRIYVCGWHGDGTSFQGHEDHVWMDETGFERYEPGDSLSFSATVYRYLKTGHGKAIDFGLKDPKDIRKVDAYELLTEDELIMQTVDQIICEVCMFQEHCYMGICIANEAWREEMRKTLFASIKGDGAREQADD